MQPSLILSPSIWGPPRRQGLCSQFAHLWAPEKAQVIVANSDFVPSIGDHCEGRGYVANSPLPARRVKIPASRFSPAREGGCSFFPYSLYAHLVFVPFYWGPPRRQGLCSQFTKSSKTSEDPCLELFPGSRRRQSGVFFLSLLSLFSLPRFGVAPWVGDTDSHALRGPLSWGSGLPRFGVPP